jgi:hypothetical protein
MNLPESAVMARPLPKCPRTRAGREESGWSGHIQWFGETIRPVQNWSMAVSPAKPASAALIARSIFVMRGQKVLLDADLAGFYGIQTKALNQAVKRNSRRFPADFMFRLTRQEMAEINRSQFVTGSRKHRDPRYPPLAFTEHGAIMAATVVNSSRAVEMSVYVVRAFVQFRQLAASNRDLARRLSQLEAHVARGLGKHDREIAEVIELIREMMARPVTRSRPIGFTADLDEV